MEIQSQNMTEGSLAKKILLFSIPLMFSNVLQVLFNMADVAVIGRFSGAQALGAVGSTPILVTLFTGFLIGMGNGVNVITSRYFGAKKDKQVSETVHSSVIICFITGVVLLIIGVTTSRLLLELLNTKEELIDMATLYLRIYFLGMPALAMYNCGSGIMSAVGNTKKPLYYLIIAGIINIALNLFFVIVVGMSVDGVAIASIISQYISAILIMRALLTSNTSFGIKLNKLKLKKDKAAAVIKIGVPTGLQYAIFAVANLVIQAAVNSFDVVMVEGNAAAANSDALVYDVMAAVYTACTSFIGQNFGAGKKKRIFKTYIICVAYSFIIGAFLGMLLEIFGKQFLALFTTEPAVREAGMERLRIMGFSYAVSAFMDSAISAARGLGKSLIPTIIVVLGSCVFRIVWVYTIFAVFGTITSLYLLYIFSWALTAFAAIIYFVMCYRKVPEAT